MSDPESDPEIPDDMEVWELYRERLRKGTEEELDGGDSSTYSEQGVRSFIHLGLGDVQKLPLRGIQL